MAAPRWRRGEGKGSLPASCFKLFDATLENENECGFDAEPASVEMKYDRLVGV